MGQASSKWNWIDCEVRTDAERLSGMHRSHFYRFYCFHFHCRFHELVRASLARWLNVNPKLSVNCIYSVRKQSFIPHRRALNLNHKWLMSISSTSTQSASTVSSIIRLFSFFSFTKIHQQKSTWQHTQDDLQTVRNGKLRSEFILHFFLSLWFGLFCCWVADNPLTNPSRTVPMNGNGKSHP